MRVALVAVLHGLLLGAPALTAQSAQAVRVNGAEPAIDGRLDDEAWRPAPPITEFVQRNPVEGAAPSESTEVRFAYTDRDLYVAFRAFDREPRQIYGRLMRRDQRSAADNVSLFIDTFNDGRTAFEFNINPSGARRDVFIYNDGGSRDDSWDPVYDWATRVDSLGWTVELRIPFSQLRFSVADSLAFGLRVRRFINRRNEELNWPFFPRDFAGEVSRYGKLVGLADVPRPRRMELLPYTAGSAAVEPAQPGNPFATGREFVARAGSDLKLGVTSGLTLDLTVNPDFGQVEADPAVVNLTAFETFFPEKRPFFVEGTNLYQFDLAPSRRDPFGFGFRMGTEEGLVYTRRIGRAPQIAAVAAGGYAEQVLQTTILGAGKLSGQIGGGWSVGVAQAVTSKELAAIADSTGGRGLVPVEPLTSYSVARAQRITAGGRIAYGLIGSATVRRLDEAAFTRLHEHAFSGGADLNVRFGRNRYELDAAVMGSHVDGAPAALQLTQRSSARYFQRPDQTYSRFDSTRTALRGAAGYARLARVVGFFTWDLRYATRSPGFEINDLGFQRRSDTHETHAQVDLRWLEPGAILRQFQWQLTQQAAFTYGGERTALSLESRVDGEFLNYWNANANLKRTFPSLAVRLLRGGPAVLEPGNWEFRAFVRSDFRRPVWANVGVSRQVEDHTGADEWGANAGIRLRPPGRFSLSVEARTQWGTNDRQYLAQRTVLDSTYYLLGRLERRELSLVLRADFALTARLSFELFAQPFVSAGRYDTLKLASDPRAAAYGDRFDLLGPDRLTRPASGERVGVDVNRDGSTDFSIREPNFRVLSLRTNAVVRWEFSPGSTLFVVWQQSRRDDFLDADLALPADLGRTLSAPGSNVFAVKVAYWIG